MLYLAPNPTHMTCCTAGFDTIIPEQLGWRGSLGVGHANP